MMNAHFKGFVGAVFALLLISHAAPAAIIKLDLGGGSGPDFVYSGAAFATPSDGNPATTGSQDTGIIFGDFLAAMPATTGSYSLRNLATNGPATVTAIGPFQFVSQPLSGGDFQVYGPAPGNTLLLDVSLASSLSVLSGTLNSSTGGIISVTNGTVVGGTLAPQMDATSISFSIALTNISGGALVLGGGNILQPFTAAATKEIAATESTGVVPEPSTMVLIAVGIMTSSLLRRRGS